MSRYTLSSPLCVKCNQLRHAVCAICELCLVCCPYGKPEQRTIENMQNHFEEEVRKSHDRNAT